MLTVIVLALVVGAGYLVYKYLKSGAEAEAAALEADIAAAEAAAKNVVTDIKAKL
jgi:hypothetical protein